MRFARFVLAAMQADQLIVQPRMGFDSLSEMRAGLKAVKVANALSVGTITLDSYTRVGEHQTAALAMQEHRGLNGYPLEGLFFLQHGVHSISLSYAQQTDQLQDVAALHVLRLLATEHLGAADWHVVLYTYMGVFPRTSQGSKSLLAESVRLARMGGAQRLIVKTVAEAHRIPTVAENIEALEFGSSTWQSLPSDKSAWFNFALAVEIYDEASQLVNAVRNLHADMGVALRLAFESGYLDIPYCLHKDNQGLSRSYIDAAGRLQWHAVGRMPITAKPSDRHKGRLDPFDFLEMLSTVEHRFDNPHYSTSLVGHRSNSVCRLLSIPKHH